MTLKLRSGIISRACLERIASGHLDNMQILAEFAKSRSRGQHAIEQEDDAPLAPTWFGERWSGNYPGGIFQWKWADGSAWASLDTFGNENGITGWTTIIRSSNEDFPPGLYRVHHCVRMPCKCSFSPTNCTPLQLHLFCIGSGISIRNVPQSRIAAEAAACAFV